jgi:hypothetical protein
LERDSWFVVFEGSVGRIDGDAATGRMGISRGETARRADWAGGDYRRRTDESTYDPDSEFLTPQSRIQQEHVQQLEQGSFQL